MKHSIPMLVVVLLFIAVFSVSAMSARSFEDIVNSRPAGFNPDQWGVGSYDGALADAAKWNNDIDGINQAACQAEGQPDKLKDECDKKKLSQVNAKEGGTGTDQGIEPLKDNVKEDLKKDAKKGEDVCGYNQACPEAAKEFEKKYKECITPCDKITQCLPNPNPPPPKLPKSVNGPTGKCYDTSQSCRASRTEIQKCNKDASDAANKKGNDEIEKKQKPGDKPQGNKLTSEQQEHCLRVINKKGDCNEVPKVATSGTISKLAAAKDPIIGALTLKCPSVDGMKCGPWDKCDKSTLTKSNCALGHSVDNILKSKGAACRENSGTPQLASSRQGVWETCSIGGPGC
ncbi:MAG: hypothetical protein AABX47_05940 [Nanoarchaeota archaeon]